jgi:hypothetical protein
MPVHTIISAARRLAIVALLGFLSAARTALADAPRPTHAFVAFGGETRMIDASGHTVWNYPAATRDGFVLPDGRLLLALSKSDAHPHGAVVIVRPIALPAGRVGGYAFLTNEFTWEGTQSEVNTAQLTPEGNIVTTEAGDHPRILELSPSGKIVLEVPLKCQTTNHHMESRMTRKLSNGNYLVPQLLDKVVREYAPNGTIVWEYKTPDEPAESWPFTAIRLANGNTLINCTHGNHVVEVDSHGTIVWHLTNGDLPEPWLKDPCGAQRLPNGNTVITSYGAGDQKLKLLEVTPEKKVVWTYEEPKAGGIHEFQIVETDGKPLPWPPLK